jgi:hypothetical protein
MAEHPGVAAGLETRCRLGGRIWGSSGAMERAMTTDQTRRVMNAYFDALETRSFAQFFTEDVVWTTIQSDTHIKGPEAVQDAINVLHARLQDLRTYHLVFAERSAYIEGSGADATGDGRIPYCVAYDLVGERIRAMRAYGDVAEFMPRSS